VQEAGEQFSDLIHRVAEEKERILVTRDGEQLVAIIPIEDLELVEALEDKIDLEEARAARQEAIEKGTVSLEELKRELGF
jgi:prevent-host-death family protein